MKLYHTSPAYLAYLQAKNKGKLNQVEDREPHERSTGGGKQAAADRRIEIQPAEDEEGMLSFNFQINQIDKWIFRFILYFRSR